MSLARTEDKLRDMFQSLAGQRGRTTEHKRRGWGWAGAGGSSQAWWGLLEHVSYLGIYPRVKWLWELRYEGFLIR